jgi:hypothetical protein
MGHRRLQPRCRGDDLIVRASATRAGVDADRFALVENGCDRIEVFVTWANNRTPRMNGIRGFLVRGGVGDVRRNHEHGDTASAASFQTGDQWLIRFMPQVEGIWSYTLADRQHTFTCTPASTRGPIRRSGSTVRWADGTPYQVLEFLDGDSGAGHTQPGLDVGVLPVAVRAISDRTTVAASSSPTIERR